MPKTGDRVIIEGTKVGQQRREGSLLGLVGSLMKVRWSDGTESLITPGAGAVRFEPGGSRGAKAAGARPKAAGARPKAARNEAPSKAAPKAKAKKAKAKAKKR